MSTNYTLWFIFTLSIHFLLGIVIYISLCGSVQYNDVLLMWELGFERKYLLMCALGEYQYLQQRYISKLLWSRKRDGVCICIHAICLSWYHISVKFIMETYDIVGPGICRLNMNKFILVYCCHESERLSYFNTSQCLLTCHSDVIQKLPILIKQNDYFAVFSLLPSCTWIRKCIL